MPDQRTEFTVTFRHMGGQCATDAGRYAASQECDDLKIMVKFGGTLSADAKATYKVVKGTVILVDWKNWSSLKGGKAIKSDQRRPGQWLFPHDTSYHKYRFHDFGFWGARGYLQIIDKIYNLKDRINEYYDFTYN